MKRPTLHILLIDDNADDCADLRQMLLQSGRRRFQFSQAALGADGVRMVLAPEHGAVDCVLLDYALPDMNALEVLAALCQGSDLPCCPVVVVTGASVDEGQQLLGAGAQDYIGKRWASTDSLTRAIENAIDRFSLLLERKRIESALVIAKAEADAANLAKTEFLLRMSHELRSPLNVILGFTQLIETGQPPPTPGQQKSVKQILQAGWYLLGLINEILELSAIDSASMVLLSQEVSLGEVLADCNAMIQPLALARGIDLHFPVFSQPCMVQADPVRIKQVLLNLLTNAIKYNRSGGRIDVRCTAEDGALVRVSVEDTGLGLSEAQLAQLFQPFNRLGQEAGTITGTGVGLVISKRLVEMMGGHMGVQSTVGVGSCFWFALEAVALPA
ncbi:response regulator [Rhodoferax lacus]|nr:response regulator [Rhodoferax lacus]